MKTILRAVAFVAMTAAAATAQSPPAGKTEAKAADYFPLKVGTKWTYRIDNGSGQKVRLSRQVTGTEADGSARLEIITDQQKDRGTERVLTNGQGVFRVEMSGYAVTPPLCLLKYPAKPGQTWDSDMKTGVGPLAKVHGSQGAPEEVEVPAGKYRAIPCTIVVTAGSEKSTNVFWFAEGVGIVKQRSELGDVSVVVELTKYEPPQ